MNNLPKNGLYMTQKDFDEWHIQFEEMYMHKVKPANGNDKQLLTKNITFVVTERCNLRCTYCYEDHHYHENGQRMTKDIGKKAIDFIFNKELVNGYYDSYESPGVVIEFIGGEPLLEIDLIDYLTDYFKFKAFELNHPWATNYFISISTNGILYNTEKVQKYIKKNKGRLSLGISIDGNKELHDACRLLPNGKGSYDIVEKAVMENIKHGEKTTKLTLAPENLPYMVDAFKHCWNLGIDIIFGNCVYEDVWKNKDAILLYENLKILADYVIDNGLYIHKYTSQFNEQIGSKDVETRNFCGGNGQMLAIGPDGVCYPCLRFMQHSMKTKRPAFTCGSIQNGLVDKYTDEKLQSLCSITMQSQSPQKCLDCEISMGCGLCTAYNYDKFGDANQRATGICIMHQARVLGNCYFWNKLYKKINLDKKFELKIPKDWALSIITEKEYDYLLTLGE